MSAPFFGGLLLLCFPLDSLARDGPTDSVEIEDMGYNKNNEKARKEFENEGFSCGFKTKCGQMDSCAEARFYLTECGLRRLDRDNDGVPCESLCR